MSTRVIFNEIHAQQAELRVLPEKMAGATQQLAMRTARDAAADIRKAYPKRSGRLRSGVEVRKGYGGGKFLASAYVVNTNPIAHNFEHGTQARHVTVELKGPGKNWGLDRGEMPAGNVFIPRMVRWRWLFFQTVKTIMEAEGITVTGDE